MAEKLSKHGRVPKTSKTTQITCTTKETETTEAFRLCTLGKRQLNISCAQIIGVLAGARTDADARCRCHKCRIQAVYMRSTVSAPRTNQPDFHIPRLSRNLKLATNIFLLPALGSPSRLGAPHATIKNHTATSQMLHTLSPKPFFLRVTCQVYIGLYYLNPQNYHFRAWGVEIQGCLALSGPDATHPVAGSSSGSGRPASCHVGGLRSDSENEHRSYMYIYIYIRIISIHIHMYVSTYICSHLCVYMYMRTYTYVETSVEVVHLFLHVMSMHTDM